MWEQQLSRYLAQCRVRNGLVEGEDTVSVPPTKDEVHSLIQYLKKLGKKPLIIGSVGLLHHMGPMVGPKDFRPTVDLDVWVNSSPGTPMPGWQLDPEAKGVPSWISPSGGTVDFLLPKMPLPTGQTPAKLSGDLANDYPVADWQSLMRLKLNSHRPKDLSDLMALVRKMGSVPDAKQLGALNATQRENLAMIKQWLAIRPHGEYGS